jgi:hypothetical protein
MVYKYINKFEPKFAVRPITHTPNVQGRPLQSKHDAGCVTEKSRGNVEVEGGNEKNLLMHAG